MSKYTTEVRYICEHSAGLDNSVGYSSIDEVLDKSRDKIFDFDFPIFDESYRAPLEDKILKHYYTREIGCETVALWKFFLARRMNEIMPYYNQLYKSELIQFNPMYDTDLTTDYQKVDNGSNEKTGEYTEQGSFNESDSHTESNSFNNTSKTNEGIVGNGESNTNSATGSETESSTSNVTNTEKDDTSKAMNDHWEYFSDTPEGQLEGIQQNKYLTTVLHTTDDGEGSEAHSETESESNGQTISATSSTTTTNTDNSYNEATNKDTTNEGINDKVAQINKDGGNDKYGNNSSNEIIKNVEDYLHHVVGKSAGVSYSKLLDEYRKTFLNIDMMIINDLKDLFMNIW